MAEEGVGAEAVRSGELEIVLAFTTTVADKGEPAPVALEQNSVKVYVLTVFKIP